MYRYKKWVVLLVGLFVLAASGASQGQPQAGGTLVLAQAGEPPGLDVHKQTSHVAWRIFELVYSTLVEFDKDLNIVPHLAKSWDISTDGLTYTFYLNQGVKFHNGQELTAEDVKFTIERILDPNTGAINRSFFTDIINIATPNRYTVVLTLSKPNVALLTHLASPSSSIVSKEVAKGKADLGKVEDIVGTGPYKLVEWKLGEYILLKRNPEYFIQGLPYIDTIKIVVVPEESTILAGLRTGSIDFAYLEDPFIVKLAEKEPNLVVYSVPMLSYHLVFINTKSIPPLADPRVRLAMSYAIDRQKMVETVMLGQGTPTGPMPIGAKLWALPPSELPGFIPNIEKAKTLLAEAGYPNGFNVSLMLSPFEPATARAEGEFIQAQLKQVGINVNLDLVEWGVYIDRWKKADFELCLGLNSAIPEPDYVFYRYFHSTGGLNFVHGWSNPKVDELLDKGRIERDSEKRREIYYEVQRILAEEAVWLWTFSSYYQYVGQSYVKGFVPMPTGSWTYLRQTYIEK
jgi:peptide/nickel transport system substrate-binding protein